VSYDFAGDMPGWSGYLEAPYLLCAPIAQAGCPDIYTARVFARPGAYKPSWAQGRWEWTAPPGTRIAGGRLQYRTRMAHAAFYARVKVRNEETAWGDARALASEVHDATLTDHSVDLPAGYRQLGVSLYNHPDVAAATVTNPWEDYVTLVRLDVDIEDPVAPALAWVDGRDLADARWHDSDVCAVVAASDAESGLLSIDAAAGGAAAAWHATPGPGYAPGSPSATQTLCLRIPDGVHDGTIGARDWTGNAATALVFRVHVDGTPPIASLSAPATTSDRRPGIGIGASDATSGVASVEAWIDGVPLPLGAGGAGTPSSDLAYGDHVVAWRVADNAGRVTAGQAALAVVDRTPPQVASLVPADGESGADVRPFVSFTAVDSGVGVDSASLRLSLDGAAVEGVSVEGATLRFRPAQPLALGVHRAVASARDRSGNEASRAWSFTLIPPPALPLAPPAPPNALGAAPVLPVAAVTPAPAGAAPPPPAVPPGATAPARATIVALQATIGANRGRRVVARFRALRNARASRGEQVRLTIQRASGREALAPRRTAADGVVRIAVDLVGAGRIVARVDGDSASVTIAAARPLTLAVTPRRPRAGRTVTASGRLLARRGATVLLEALATAGWVTVARQRARPDGGYRLTALVPRPGRYLLRTRIAAGRRSSVTVAVQAG